MAIIFSGLNVSKWISLSTMKKDAKLVSSLAKTVLGSEKSSDAESLDSWALLMKKTGITEDQLKVRLKTSRLMFRVYSVFGSLLFLYSIYLFAHAHSMSGFLSITFSLFMFSHAFHEHFFIFNCKHKKVNSTLIEWFSGTFFKKTNK